MKKILFRDIAAEIGNVKNNRIPLDRICIRKV